jgi:hypothetical protein
MMPALVISALRYRCSPAAAPWIAAMTDWFWDWFWVIVAVVFAVAFLPHWYALVYAFMAGVLFHAAIHDFYDRKGWNSDK